MTLPNWPASSLSAQDPPYSLVDSHILSSQRALDRLHAHGSNDNAQSQYTAPSPYSSPYIAPALNSNNICHDNPQPTSPSTAQQSHFYPSQYYTYENDFPSTEYNIVPESSLPSRCTTPGCARGICDGDCGLSYACDDPLCGVQPCDGETCSVQLTCCDRSCEQDDCAGTSSPREEHYIPDSNTVTRDEPSPWRYPPGLDFTHSITQGQYTTQDESLGFQSYQVLASVEPSTAQALLSDVHGSSFDKPAVFSADGIYRHGGRSYGHYYVGLYDAPSNDPSAFLHHGDNADSIHNVYTMQDEFALQSTSYTPHETPSTSTPTPAPALGDPKAPSLVHSVEASSQSEGFGEPAPKRCQWLIAHDATGPPHQCGVAFETASELHRHIKQVHVKPLSTHDGFRCRWFGCPRCELDTKGFEQKGKLDRHMVIHTNYKPHTCSYDDCGMSFPSKQALDNHNNTHTGDRPYKCDFEGCRKMFKQATQLTCHKRTHTNERPFKCDTCGKTFGESSNFNKHKRTHDRIYVCEHAGCGEDYSKFEGLERHCRSKGHCVDLLCDDEARAQFRKTLQARHQEQQGVKMKERKVRYRKRAQAEHDRSASEADSDG